MSVSLPLSDIFKLRDLSFQYYFITTLESAKERRLGIRYIFHSMMMDDRYIVMVGNFSLHSTITTTKLRINVLAMTLFSSITFTLVL